MSNSSLFLRNLFFTILQPGVVAGLIPYLMLKDSVPALSIRSLPFICYAGMLIFLAGFVIMMHCIIRFATQGKGTLSPADPTLKLVTTGLYRYSRNPMYVGVMLMLIGEAVFFQVTSLWIYSLIIFTAFNLFILLAEEPRLRKEFGEEYELYSKKVRRWF